MSLPPDDDLLEHLAGLRRVARALCAQQADADDVVQEGALAALQAPLERPRSLGAWFSGLGRNLARSRVRAESRRATRERGAARSESVPSAEARAERLELATRLVAYVRDLPEAQAEVIFLHFWEGLPPREIATRLGVGVETIKTRQKRALQALRERLFAETPGGRERWLSALAALPVTAAGESCLGAAWTAGGLLLVKKLALAAGVVAAGCLAWWTLREAQPERAPDAPAAPTSALAQRERERELAPAPVAASSERKPAVESLTARPGTWLIVGRVMDVSGDAAPAPAAHASVRAYREMLGADELDASAACDEQGAFQIEIDHALIEWPADPVEGGPATKKLTVEAHGDAHFRKAQAQVTVARGTAEVHAVALERFAHGGLEGSVVDALGAGVPQVDVRALSGEEELGAATSDGEGRFRIAPLTAHSELVARKEGWAVIDAPDPLMLERGQWEEARIVMAPAGALRVQVEDGASRPIEGALVSVDLSPAERFGSERSFGPDSRPLSLRTDRNGAAHFPSVWAGLELRVGLAGQTQAVYFERESLGAAERPETPRAPSSRAIQVEPGRETKLSIAVGSRHVVRGSAVKQDGSPVAGAVLRIVAPRVPGLSEGTVLAYVESDESGRFELAWSAFAPLGRGRLIAGTADLMFWLGGVPDDLEPPHAGSLELDLDAPPQEEVTVVLEPTQSIEGRVLDPEGRGVRAAVRAAPKEPSPFGWMLTNGAPTQTHSEADGSFRLVGLPAGRFDVFASSDPWARTAAEDVPTGTHDLILSFEGERPVTVEIEIVCPLAELAQVIVLRGGLEPERGRDVEAPELARQATHADPLGWPKTALGLYYGSEGDVTEHGSVLFDYWPIQASSSSIQLDEGLYWLGAKGRTKDGSHCFPVGTGLVRVSKGTYKLRFELAPTSSVEGRALGPGASDLCAALHLPDGRALPLDVRREVMQALAELGAQGTFYFAHVPVGELELRLGTAEELQAGGARAVRRIQVRQGQPLKLEIEL